MSYLTISVREAMNNINANVNGWFLPAVQRPYVWGSRYQAEQFICKLFDSLLKGYPIGGLIIWNTRAEVPYREFLKDYVEGEIPKIVDKGKFGREDKWLVYDGQQRLQTLFSCLRYTFQGRVLVFDLLHDANLSGNGHENGFLFTDAKQEESTSSIRMTELFSKLPDPSGKVDYRKSILSRLSSLSEEEKTLVETNLERLWTVFVSTDSKALAYFPIESNDESKVNE